MNDTLDLSVVDTIYLDIDDTLNSLTLTIMGRVFGCPVGSFDYDKFPTELGYDVLGAVNLMLGLEGDEGWGLEQFWDAVPRQLWAKAPISKEMDYLVERSAQLVGRENVFLAPSPTKCPESHAGKCEWINSKLPEWLRRQYFITPRKVKLSNREALLIDDHDTNIEMFRVKGQGLVVPRPWNKYHTVDTMSHLVEHLGELE